MTESLPQSKAFLQSVLSGIGDPLSHRPRITLTYAQSLDGKIAGKEGKQLILSGRESMVMTHWMRTMHDGILVGIGTAINDDPQLNTRQLPSSEGPYPQPRPIILDSDCRLPISSKLIRNFADGRGRQPWVVCSDDLSSGEKVGRKSALEAAGAKVIEVSRNTDSLDIPSALLKLKLLGIDSLMVEGGQRVISSFLGQDIDALIVTVAPVFVGSGGTGAVSESSQVPRLKHLQTLNIGRDSVIGCEIER